MDHRFRAGLKSAAREKFFELQNAAVVVGEYFGPDRKRILTPKLKFLLQVIGLSICFVDIEGRFGVNIIGY